MTVTLVTFALFLLAFTGIGLASASQSQGTTEDYLVAGRDVPAWLAALSSVATNNSGFMFIGLIGYTYRDGLQTLWMALAWLLGDWFAWMWVHGPVRTVSGRLRAHSVPELLGTSDDGDRSPLIAVTGLITFFFLGGYAAAQLNAGATALHGLFDLPMWVGATVGAVIVVAYSFSGGIRASIWTDAAQAGVMFAAMLLLLGVSMAHVGGPFALYEALHALDPALVQWWPTATLSGLGLYVLGFVAGGFGAIGQPHILVRTMSLDSPASIPRARAIYMAWFAPFYVAAVLLALYARVQLPELALADPTLSADAAQQALTAASEGALPRLAALLLPDVLVGMVLAGLFSATMSTADSQILACSAAVTQDVWPRYKHSPVVSKLATLTVTALALGLALSADEGVFALVLGAWAVLASTLGPLLIARLVDGRPPAWPLGLAMIGSGLVTLQVWQALGWGGLVYRALPGLLVPLALWGLGRTVRPPVQ